MQVLNFIIGCILLTLTILPAKSSLAASIGEVTLKEGNSVIDRKDGDKGVVVEKALDIFSYDTVKTGKGKVGIEFLDDTRVDVTEHSKLIIDEFVYDPNSGTGKLSLKATLGTVRYASGQIAKNSAQNISIKTPTATVSVRGTDFTMTIDELGSSTIILLPSCDATGACLVGEISVDSGAGQVILNQAFQATVVDTVQARPMKPVLLELDENMINNLLIISKPPAIETQQEHEEKIKAVGNALDLDFLQFDDLDIDLLDMETEDAFASALDIDFLEQNFLVDILAQLNKQLAVKMKSEFDKSKTKTSGQDEFGIILINEEPQWVWIREDEAGNVIHLRLDQEQGYNINVIQQGFEIIDYELGEGDNEIYIIQNQ
tara:strand:- start:595 stop:1716 length:1122 start_codon:yes stop_codon:yes gene_type:complete